MCRTITREVTMYIQVHKDNTASFNQLTQTDGRTIWFALEALKDSYKLSLIPPAGTNLAHEDEMFLYSELARVTALQFELMENYDPDTKHTVQEWFYI
jgi:hypothetical protein